MKERADTRCTVRRIAAGSLESVVVQFLGELGKHPDVVGAAVGSSQTRRRGRIDELKKQLGCLDRELKATSVRIRNCVEAIAAGGKQIAGELAEQVASLKHKQQGQTVERQRMSQELAACEGEVLDAQRVERAIGKFGLILSGLSRDEQKTLVGLFVERIEVRPGKGDKGAGAAASVRHLELRLKLNLPRLVEGMEEQALIQPAGRPSLATGMTITAEVALGQQGRASQALVLTPFRCGDERTLQPVVPESKPAAGRVQHPILKARVWRHMLSKDADLSLRRLAERVGEAPSTLVHHFKLLKLAPDIQIWLARQREPKAIHFFSLRRLMPLAKLGEAEQRKFFRHLQTEFASSIAIENPAPGIAAHQSIRRVNKFRIG